MIQFYAPEIESTLTLPESDSGHCVRVLRMKEGDMIEIIDGRGHRFTCRLSVAHHKRAKVEIVRKQDVLLPWRGRVTVAVAPTKNMDRMEWLIEKLTEIGINRFVPVLCSHSERKEIKTERLEKIAVSAMKQSLKAVLPEIMPMMPFNHFIDFIKVSNAQKFIAYCDKTVERHILSREIIADRDMVILIGPEGDFSRPEVDTALSNGFTPVTLGDNRLRTETAALVSVDTYHIINQLIDK